MAALTFKIDSNKEKYYQQIITILRYMPPFSLLRTQEIFVLAELMYYYNEIKKAVKEEKEINLLLFSSKRNLIIDKLMLDDDDGTSYEKAYIKLSNILVSLRKKNFILKIKNKDVLNPTYIFNPDKMNKLEFTFNFK